MPDAPTAVQYGVGPIGSRVVQTAVDRGYEFVGAVDVDQDKVGKDLGTVTGIDELGVDITDNPEAALSAGPDVVFNSTVSDLGTVRPQVEAAMAAGADVVSTCKEMAYPWRANPEEAAALDETAREQGQTCLGTGINPGFAMDVLPAVLTGANRRVDSVSVERVQDAADRRGPLQAMIGAGLEVDAFEAKIALEAGHVGLPESVAMLGDALGWGLGSIGETIEPVVADERVESDHVTVEAGQVAGIHQVATGTVDGETRIEVDLSIYLGAPDPHDEIRIEGMPDVHSIVEGGFPGDVATAAVAVNVMPSVRDADPGLITMLDVPLPTFQER
ncbi:MAG: hypothetical protein ACI9EZ_002041 [Halobacteriales archaeon]|jgi:hypothetical protein